MLRKKWTRSRSILSLDGRTRSEFLLKIIYNLQFKCCIVINLLEKVALSPGTYAHFLNRRGERGGVIRELRNNRGSDCIWSPSTLLAVDIAKYSRPTVTRSRRRVVRVNNCHLLWLVPVQHGPLHRIYFAKRKIRLRFAIRSRNIRLILFILLLKFNSFRIYLVKNHCEITFIFLIDFTFIGIFFFSLEFYYLRVVFELEIFTFFERSLEFYYREIG